MDGSHDGESFYIVNHKVNGVGSNDIVKYKASVCSYLTPTIPLFNKFNTSGKGKYDLLEADVNKSSL